MNIPLAQLENLLGSPYDALFAGVQCRVVVERPKTLLHRLRPGETIPIWDEPNDVAHTVTLCRFRVGWVKYWAWTINGIEINNLCQK